MEVSALIVKRQLFVDGILTPANVFFLFFSKTQVRMESLLSRLHEIRSISMLANVSFMKQAFFKFDLL